MANISLKLYVTHSEKETSVNLEAYGMDQSKWQQMSERGKKVWLHENVICNLTPPSWVIDKVN